MQRTRRWLLALAALVMAAGAGAADAPKPDAAPAKQNVSGIVKDDKGNPVEGAEVVLVEISIQGNSGKPGATVKTDATGKFTFENTRALDPRTDQAVTLLIASKPGFAWCGKGIESPKALPASGVEMKLESPQPLGGQVVNLQGQPVAGAMLYPLAMKQGSGRDMDVIFILTGMDHFAIKTDAQGKFTFDRLPADCRVGFQVRHPDYANLSIFPSGQGLVFKSGQTDIKLELAKAGKIQGQVLDEAKKPVAGLTLSASMIQSSMAQANSSFFSNTATTGNDGRYEFKNLAPGEYTITPRQDPKGQQASGLVEPRNGIKLAEGATLTGIDLTQTKGCQVTGLVFDQKTGKGVASAQITAYLRKDNQNVPTWFGSAKTDDKGRFELHAPAGTITVQANAENYIENQQAPQTVEAKAGDTPAEIQIALQPDVAKVIKGLVVDPDGKPVAGATVRQGSSFGERQETVTGPDGRFEIKRSSRRYSGMPDDKSVFAYLHEKGLATMAPVDSDKELVELTIKLQPAGIVTGRVLDENKKPLTSAKIQLRRMIRNGGSNYISSDGNPVDVDKEGRYRINTLCDGTTYWMEILAVGHGTVQFQDVTAKAGQEIDKGDSMLPRADLYVDGVVVDQFGQPVEGAQIYYSGNKQPSTGDSINTDLAGKFRIGPLVAGELRINANKSGYNYSSQEVMVSREASAPVEIEMINQSGATTRLNPGAEAPALEGVEWLQGQGDLKSLQGKPAVLVFFAPGNRACARGLEKLAALEKDAGDGKLAVIGISDASQPADAVKQFIEKKGLKITYGRVSDARKQGWGSPAFRAYEVRSVPGITLIDGAGKIRAANVSLNELDKAVKELTGGGK